MRPIRACFVAAAVVATAVAFAQRKPESPTPTELPFVASKKWAIVVGASNYTHFSKLDYADNDAVAFANTLKSEFSFDEKNVRLLTDGKEGALAPSAGNILGEVEDILASKSLDKSDLFIFFFSGHGIGTENGDFLLPTDARNSTVERVGLPISEVISRFTKAGLANVLIIVDACRSGKENPFGKQLQELGMQANLAVMLGCAPGARSYEIGDLQHGLFADTLLKAMKDPTLRDTRSGSLWASKVAQSVKDRVYEYSERDHPDEPQTPSVWSDMGADVLLGAYVTATTSVDALKGEAARLGPEAHAAALATYAEELMNADRYDDAIEIMKTLEGLGKQTHATRYLLGAALTITGRSAEAGEAFDNLAKSDAPSYYKNLGVVTDQRAVPATVRVAAAKALWEEDKSDPIAGIIWNSLRSQGAKSDILWFIEAAGKAGLSRRMTLSLQGESAYLKADYKEAARLYGEALASEGDAPDPVLLGLAQYTALTLVGDVAEIDRFLAERIANGGRKALWLCTKARRQKDAGDIPGAMNTLKEAARASPSSYDLLEIAKIVGRRNSEVEADLLAAARGQKLSWRAKLVEAFAEFPKNVSNIVTILSEVDRLADDAVTATVASIDLFDTYMRESFDDGLITQQDYVNYVQAVYPSLQAMVEKFGDREAAWWTLTTLAANLERDEQVAAMMRRLLATQIAAGRLSPGTALSVLITATNAGDYKTAEAVHNALAPNGDGGDISRVWCIALAAAGRFDEAKKILPKIIPYPNAEKDLALVALKAWVLAETKDKDSAKRLLERLQPTEPYAKQMAALAHAALGDWKAAEPALKEALTTRSWGYLPVSIAALAAYDQHAREGGDKDKWQEVAFISSVSHPDNPMQAKFHYALKPDVKAFDGVLEFAVIVVPDLTEPFGGTLKLTIASGKVSGVMESEGNVLIVDATVDGFGNLTGSVRGGGKTLTIRAKIAPHKMYASYSKLREVGQVFLLYDVLSERTAWVARPKPSLQSLATQGLRRPLVIP